MPKPYEPTLHPKPCQRACKTSPREEFQNFSHTLKDKIKHANTRATQKEKKIKSIPGTTAGQTIDHVHIHLIPRYAGDVERPLGGVRGVIPERKEYEAKD